MFGGKGEEENEEKICNGQSDPDSLGTVAILLLPLARPRCQLLSEPPFLSHSLPQNQALHTVQDHSLSVPWAILSNSQ